MRSSDITAVDVLCLGQRYPVSTWHEKESFPWSNEVVLALRMTSTQLSAEIFTFREAHGNVTPSVDVLIWTKSLDLPLLMQKAYVADCNGLALVIMGDYTLATYEELEGQHIYTANKVRDIEIKSEEENDPELKRFRQLVED